MATEKFPPSDSETIAHSRVQGVWGEGTPLHTSWTKCRAPGMHGSQAEEGRQRGAGRTPRLPGAQRKGSPWPHVTREVPTDVFQQEGAWSRGKVWETRKTSKRVTHTAHLNNRDSVRGTHSMGGLKQDQEEAAAHMLMKKELWQHENIWTPTRNGKPSYRERDRDISSPGKRRTRSKPVCLQVVNKVDGQGGRCASHRTPLYLPTVWDGG